MKWLLGVLLVLIVAAPAEAFTNEQAQKAIDVARAFWPGSPCEGREVIVWETPESQAARFGVLRDAGGWWDRGTCQVHVAPHRSHTAAWLCATLIHEFGHAAGHEHSTDPLSPMAETPRLPAPVCSRAFPPPPAPTMHYRCWRSAHGVRTCALLKDSVWLGMRRSAQRKRAAH